MATTPLIFNVVNISTSPVQVINTTTPLHGGIEIKASNGNAGYVYVGVTNTVTAGTVAATDGYELAAGQCVFLPSVEAPDASGVYLISNTSNQRCSINAF
jgi:hypothetical protein